MSNSIESNEIQIQKLPRVNVIRETLSSLMSKKDQLKKMTANKVERSQPIEVDRTFISKTVYVDLRKNNHLYYQTMCEQISEIATKSSNKFEDVLQKNKNSIEPEKYLNSPVSVASNTNSIEQSIDALEVHLKRVWETISSYKKKKHIEKEQELLGFISNDDEVLVISSENSLCPSTKNASKIQVVDNKVSTNITNSNNRSPIKEKLDIHNNCKEHFHINSGQENDQAFEEENQNDNEKSKNDYDEVIKCSDDEEVIVLNSVSTKNKNGGNKISNENSSASKDADKVRDIKNSVNMHITKIIKSPVKEKSGNQKHDDNIKSGEKAGMDNINGFEDSCDCLTTPNDNSSDEEAEVSPVKPKRTKREFISNNNNSKRYKRIIVSDDSSNEDDRETKDNPVIIIKNEEINELSDAVIELLTDCTLENNKIDQLTSNKITSLTLEEDNQKYDDNIRSGEKVGMDNINGFEDSNCDCLTTRPNDDSSDEEAEVSPVKPKCDRETSDNSVIIIENEESNELSEADIELLTDCTLESNKIDQLTSNKITGLTLEEDNKVKPMDVPKRCRSVSPSENCKVEDIKYKSLIEQITPMLKEFCSKLKHCNKESLNITVEYLGNNTFAVQNNTPFLSSPAKRRKVSVENSGKEHKLTQTTKKKNKNKSTEVDIVLTTKKSEVVKTSIKNLKEAVNFHEGVDLQKGKKVEKKTKSKSYETEITKWFGTFEKYKVQTIAPTLKCQNSEWVIENVRTIKPSMYSVKPMSFYKYSIIGGNSR